MNLSILPIAINNCNFHNKNNVSSKSIQQDSFIPTFKGNYKDILVKTAINPFKTDKMAEEGFKNMFNAIKNDKDIEKSDAFFVISDIYEKQGFRGLMYELWRAIPSKEIESILPKGDEYKVTLAKSKDYDLMVLSDYTSNDKLSARNVHLSFQEKPFPEESQNNTFVNYGMDKKGEYITSQLHNGRMMASIFHPETGNLRKTIRSTHDYSETTYYKKDGSKDGLRNFFFGGTPTYGF